MVISSSYNFQHLDPGFFFFFFGKEELSSATRNIVLTVNMLFLL